MEVGFIGLGRMGAAMAQNIARAGHRVKAWNRTKGAAKDLEGITEAASPDEAFQADAVMTMLSEDDVIRDVLLTPGVLGRARPGLVHVVTATISVAFAADLARAHAEAGLGYVSAPVFGRPDAAQARQLHVLTGGRPEAVARVRSLLEAVGQKIWPMGDDPGQANAAKVAGNMMITMAIEAMAEAVVLTKAHGVEPDVFLSLITGTLFGGKAYEGYGAKIVKGDQEPGFLMRLGLKDLRLAAEAGGERSRTLPMLQAVRGRMQEAADSGLAERDWSAMAGFTISKGS